MRVSPTRYAPLATPTRSNSSRTFASKAADVFLEAAKEANSAEQIELIVSARLPALLRVAEDRGDLYLHTNLQVGDTNLLWLVHDDPKGALRVVDESMGRWSQRSFQTQHYYELQARTNVDLYRGDAEGALARTNAGFKELRKALQLRIFVTRLKAHHLRARAAIGTAA